MANSTVQLRPLKDRLSKAELAKRRDKIQARAIVANQLAREIGLTRMMVQQVARTFNDRFTYVYIALAVLVILVALALFRTF